MLFSDESKSALVLPNKRRFDAARNQHVPTPNARRDQGSDHHRSRGGRAEGQGQSATEYGQPGVQG